MFGILDRIYERNKRGTKSEEINFQPSIKYKSLSLKSSYCFVPRAILKNKSLRESIIPQNGKVSVYTVSYSDILVPDAKETLENLRGFYYDARERINEDIADSLNINLIGVSLGNVLSVRCASDLPEVNDLVSIVGGARLGLSAWDSILTRDVARNSGCSTAEEYERALGEFSPINYLDRVKAERVFARFGTSDIIIPYDPQGRDLKKALKQVRAEEHDIKSYPFADHGSALFFSSKAGIHR